MTNQVRSDAQIDAGIRTVLDRCNIASAKIEIHGQDFRITFSPARSRMHNTATLQHAVRELGLFHVSTADLDGGRILIHSSRLRPAPSAAQIRVAQIRANRDEESSYGHAFAVMGC